jgi:hypothetical protein
MQDEHVGLQPIAPRLNVRRGTPQGGERTVRGGGHIFALSLPGLTGQSSNTGFSKKSGQWLLDSRVRGNDIIA